jgi:hypothetical protein|tara:strand:+ start:438 stop:650 length:213 start_codon:yes stop_codon:yes gene_type:complete
VEKQIMLNKKNFFIIIFIIAGMFFILSFNDHNFKRAVDACLAGSQKLSESKITDLKEAKKFCEEQIKKNK